MKLIKKLKISYTDFITYYNDVLQGTKYKKFSIFCDAYWSYIKYGSSISDYFLFRFYEKKSLARKEFFCFRDRRKFFRFANAKDVYFTFNDKPTFLTRFSKYVGRKYFDVQNGTLEAFKEYISSVDASTFMVKPACDSSCGRGIYVLTITPDSDLNDVFEQLKSEGSYIEEMIVQHSKMAELNPNSVNTIRIATFRSDEKVSIIGAVLRIGSGDDCIDNYCAGGMLAKIDPESGTVITQGVNRFNQNFVRHTKTGVIITGFQIPHWDKVLDLVNTVALEEPKARYVGWDVAIRENDVVLVEGNIEGMFNIYQSPENKGIKKEVLSIIGENQ